MDNTNRQPRRTWIAAALWLFLGAFGAHLFYLRRELKLAKTMLVVGVLVVLVSAVLGGFVSTLVRGIYGLFVLSHVVRLGRWVRESNGELSDPGMISLDYRSSGASDSEKE